MDWDRPAGAVFYFDGDGTTRTEQPGGRFATRLAEATPATDGHELTWIVGDRDGAWATDSGSWSARAAATQAQAEYREAGYEQARRITTAGPTRTTTSPPSSPAAWPRSTGSRTSRPGC